MRWFASRRMFAKYRASPSKPPFKGIRDWIGFLIRLFPGGPLSRIFDFVKVPLFYFRNLGSKSSKLEQTVLIHDPDNISHLIMKQQQQKKELLPFRVIYSSSEQDADHSAIDFGLRSMIPSIYQPGTDRNSCEHQNGWRSSKAFDSTRDAHYPHEIGIQFPTSSSTKCHYHYVDEVHFMMPNEHIPQHVSIHYVPAASASCQPLAYQSHPGFLALGYVTRSFKSFQK